jgi:hypothetical protein
MTTVRGSEVLADPTTALALEAATRRASGEDAVRRCAVSRVLRMQPLPDVPGFTRHFTLFALVSAGRSHAGHGFEVRAMRVARSIVDGGSVDWTQRLLSDRRERLFVSGLGLEMLVRLAAPDEVLA